MPFTKGDPNINRNGRPKKEVSIPHILREILNETIGTDEKITRLEAILRVVVQQAYEGEAWAVHYLSDRTEGKAIETVRTQEVKDEIVIE